MRALAVALLALTAACSRGPDASQGGLELQYRIAPRPERAGQEAALAAGAAKIITERLKAAGCRGEVRASLGYVRVRLPGTCGDLARLTQLIGLGGRLEFREISEDEALAALARRLTPEAGVAVDVQSWDGPGGRVSREHLLKGSVAALERVRAGLAPDALPKHLEALIEAPARPGEPALLRLVKRDVALTGAAVKSATVESDPATARPYIAITFTREGGEAFAQLTKRLVHQKLAIVLDGKINSAPVVQSEIRGGRARITMGGARDATTLLAEARDLAIVLQSGALPEGLELASQDVYPQPPPQELKLAMEGQQVVIRLSSGGLWRTGNPPTPAELEPVMATARAAARRPRLELLVRGGFDVPEPTRLAVGKAISAAGGESVFCRKDNRNCR